MSWKDIGLGALCFLALGLFFYAASGMETRVRHAEGKIEELVNMTHEIHRAKFDYDGSHYEFASRQGESFEVFMLKCEAYVFENVKTESMEFCWESDCTRTVPPFGVYHVELCADSQAQLDDDVARYCAMTTHVCDNCK